MVDQELVVNWCLRAGSGGRAVGSSRWILVVAALCVVLATPARSQETTRGAGQFVRAFYQWYVPKAASDHLQPAWYAVLGQSRFPISDTLLAEIRTDSAVQATDSGAIGGLDFDPFLNSQDPCDRYEVGSTHSRPEHAYLVDVHAVCSGGRDSTPTAQMLVGVRRRKLTLLNVFYPGLRDDLVSLLRRLHPHSP